MIVRAVDYSYVAEKAFRRKETGLLVKYGAKELVSRAKSFHENVTFAVMNHLDCLCNSLQFIRIVHNSEFRCVDTSLDANVIDKSGVTYENSFDESEIHSL